MLESETLPTWPPSPSDPRDHSPATQGRKPRPWAAKSLHWNELINPAVRGVKCCRGVRRRFLATKRGLENRVSLCPPSPACPFPNSFSSLSFCWASQILFCSPGPHPLLKVHPRWHLPLTYFPLDLLDLKGMLGSRRAGEEWADGEWRGQGNGVAVLKSQGYTQASPQQGAKPCPG